MTEKHLNIPIYVQHNNVVLSLYGENSDETLIEINDASENGEAPFQIKEGCFIYFIKLLYRAHSCQENLHFWSL